MAEAKDNPSPPKLEYASTRRHVRRTVWLPIVALLASLTTGYQLYRLVMWGVWGRVGSPLEGIGLLGTLIVFVGAIVAWRLQGIGAVTIVAGCLMLWLFYAPALATTLAHWRAIPIMELVIVLLPPALLIATTLFALAYLLMSPAE